MIPLEIRDSTIDGKGLFACVEFKRKAKVTVITGELITTEEFQKCADKRYMVYWKKDIFLDAIHSQSLGKYINTAGKSGFKNNAKFTYDRRNNCISVIATRNILPGEEILAPYGGK